MSLDINQKHMSVLVALQENPLATYEWISNRLGLSKSIVFGLIQDLSHREKPYFNVSANVDNHALDLETVDLLVTSASEEKTVLIEKLCYEHPYTSYRARCFGHTNGLYLQFTVPSGTRQLIKELFQTLLEKEAIDDYKILPFTGSNTLLTTPTVDSWSPDTHRWSFDWDNWFNLKSSEFKPEKPSEEPGFAKNWITKSDIAIISELKANSRRKNIDIISSLEKKGFSFTPQTFSRRLKRIKKQCIKNYRLHLNATIFDLYSSVLICGSGDADVISKLQGRIQKYPIHFLSTFKATENRILWYLHLPQSHLSDLMFNFRKQLRDICFNYIDYNRALSYLPWAPTFSDETSDWRKDREFFIESVLKKLDV